MNKKSLVTGALLVFLLSGCTSTVKKEDILLQARQIKISAGLLEPVPAVEPSTTPEPAKPVEIIPAVLPTKEPLPQYFPLPVPEKLVYKAKYLGMPIGEFILKNNGKKMLGGREAYCFEVIVKTLPFFAKIFHTKDRYVSYMDAEKFVVLRHEEYVEGGAFLESAVDFDYVNHTAAYQNFIDRQQKTTPIPDQILDVFSGGFYLRMIPWELGDTVELNIYADEVIYNYVGLLHSETATNLPPYGNQEVYLLKPYVFLNGKQIKKASAEVLFATAGSRKTLRAVLKSGLGSVHVTLTEGFDPLDNNPRRR